MDSAPCAYFICKRLQRIFTYGDRRGDDLTREVRGRHSRLEHRALPILRLVRMHAALSQLRRAVDGEGRIVATPDDYAAVRPLARDWVATTAGGVYGDALPGA